LTSPGFRGTTTTAAALVLVLTLAMEGCGASTGAARQAPAPSSPAATGTGPYPTPSDPVVATPPPADAVGSPKGGVPEPGGVDQTDADAIAKGTLTTMWTFDTSVDRQPYDAEVRAADAGWLITAYADRLRAHQPQSVPGAQWRQWTHHRAYTTVTLQKAADAAEPADSATDAWRQWIVTATPHGRDRWTGTPAPVVAYVHLTRSAAGRAWRTADVTVQ
jgi:hypothetical protein